MIFYFSGSGNSYYAANVIAEKLDTPLISMAKCLQSSKLDFDARHDMIILIIDERGILDGKLCK